MTAVRRFGFMLSDEGLAKTDSQNKEFVSLGQASRMDEGGRYRSTPDRFDSFFLGTHNQ